MINHKFKLFLEVITISLLIFTGCSSENGYENAFDFRENYAAVKINNLYGFINNKGNLVIPPSYDSADYFVNGLAIVKKDGLYGAIDKHNKVVLPFQHEEITIWDKFLISARKNGKYGCLNYNNEILLDFTYEEPLMARTLVSGDKIVITTENGKKGLVLLNSDIVIEPKYKDIYTTSVDENILTLVDFVDFSDKYGFINLHTGYILEPKFYSAPNFVNDLWAVNIEDKYGYMNGNGEMVISPVYDFAYNFNKGLALVMLSDSKDYKIGFINKDGEAVIPIKYSSYQLCKGDKILVYEGEKHFVYDYSGNLLDIVPASLVSEYSTSEIDPDILNIYIDYDSNGDAVSIIQNLQGEILSKSNYSSVLSFYKEGFLIVERLGKWGCINTRFIETVPLKYDDISYVGNGLLLVNEGEEYKLIDKDNKEILSQTYNTASIFRDYMIVLEKDEKVNLYNIKTMKLLPLTFDEVKESFEGLIPVRQGERWFYIDDDGNKQF